MAQAVGLVQLLNISPESSNTESMACVWIGPTPNNAEMFVVRRTNSDSARRGAFKNSMVDALATALVGRREVVVFHADDDSEISGLGVNPV